MAGLYIGRFQPFHLGHLDAVHQAFEQEKFLYIGIGSAEDNFTPDNPFTSAERYQMIQAALDESGISHETYAIIPVRNINNYLLWPSHVELLIPPFEVVYTNSDIVESLFLKQGKHPITRLVKTLDICSTDIRKKMLAGSEDWKKMVPKKVEELLTAWNATKRIQEV